MPAARLGRSILIRLSASRVACAVLVCALLAAVLTWISGNLAARFDHRLEVIQDQNIIFQGKAATDYVVDGEVRGANSDYYYGILQSRMFFPSLLVGTTAALNGRLSESQVYLVLTSIFAFLGLLTFCLLALWYGLSLSQMLLAMLCLSLQTVVRFNDGWEHPTDFPDLALTVLMLLCVVNKQRWALIAVIVLMSFNLESGVFASVVWLFLYAVGKWRVAWTELGFAAFLGVFEMALNAGLRYAFGGPTALVHTRLQELQSAPAALLATFTQPDRNPLWAWPVLLAAAYVVPGVWMLDHRDQADARIKRLLLASAGIAALVSVTGIASELRDFATSMTTYTFAGVCLAARPAERGGPSASAAARAGPRPEQVLASMSLEQKVGQVFMLGFEGTTLTPANRALIHDLHLGGVTLFARNIEHAQQLQRLDAELQGIADPVPLFISVDQEGGLVVRVTQGATIFPGNMAVGATGDPSLARRLAEAEAKELLAMGVNMDLAPVIDVNTNPLNPVIGVRAFGSEPGLVSQMGVATIEGLQRNGVSAVGKHFPGHGDTAVDSHLDLPVVPHSLERLEAIELQPFRAAIQAGVDGLMTAHVYVPAIEPEAARPATLSQAVLTGLLRTRLGYTGLILTDALDMGAITRDRTAAEAAVEAFEAGADMLLVAGITAEDRAHLFEGPPALLAAVQSGRVSEERLDASVLRILEAKARRGILAGPREPPPMVRHDELALEVARQAITLQRDDRHVLPLRPEQKVLVVTPDAPTRTRVQEDELPGSLLEAVQRFAPTVSEVASADVIVLGTYDLAQDPAQQELARSLMATGKPVVAVSLRGPYDAALVPTMVAAYGDRPVHLQAAAEALFGQLRPTGKAP